LLRTPRMLGLQVVPQTSPCPNQGLRKHGPNPRIVEQQNRGHMARQVKPPFSYYGGKTTLAPQIADLLPEHDHYVEPFAGSLAVLLAKDVSRCETVNDLDGDLMTFWRVLRDSPEQFERACAMTPHSRAEYENSGNLEALDDME